jgi:hypothetical protein
MTDDRLGQELASFQELWKGGYWAADPLRHQGSAYGIFGQMGTSHATYLRCIKPYVHEQSAVLEIGPGRGAWTKTFLRAKRVHCMDALSAEHNGFWENVGKLDHVTYEQVRDFACGSLQDDTFTYAFSYDALCHVSFEGITAYAKNLFPKLRAGADCFFMVADYEKYNAFVAALDEYSALATLLPKNKMPWLKALWRPVNRFYARRYGLRHLDVREDDTPRPGRWYHAGTGRTCALLRDVGYEVRDEDVGTDFRSPIIHFAKP